MEHYSDSILSSEDGRVYEHENEEQSDDEPDYALGLDIFEDFKVDISSDSDGEYVRLHVISELKDVWEKRKELRWRNSLLHKKCCDYFLKIKMLKSFEKSLIASHIHADPRYETVLEEYKSTKTHFLDTKEFISEELKLLEDTYSRHQTEFDQVLNNFVSRELEIGILCFAKSPILSKNAHKKVTDLLNGQRQRLNDLVKVRVNYLKLTDCFKSLQHQIDELTNLGGGRSLTDYESLLMHKNVLAEEVDRCEKQLRRVRDKCFTILHKLAHVKEVSITVVRDTEISAKQLSELESMRHEQQISVVNRERLRKVLRKKISVTRYMKSIVSPRA